MSSSENYKIPLEEILSATGNFSEANIIGRGGFGNVYRGQSTQHGILAIKRLDREHGQGDRQFGNEITLLSAYKHENLVVFVGFCEEGGEKVLVYKFETNGSLDKHLDKKDLTWERRLQICIDATRGMRYLHDEVGPGHRVIHRDIKSSNILLDENWKAKISDLGLSKIGLANVPYSGQFSNPCGTYGYIDPEFIDGRVLTQKTDVYSLGVVMFEVLFGKLVSHRWMIDDHHFTVKIAKYHYENNTLDMLIDPDLWNQMTSDSLRTFSTIAYQCVKKHGVDRPIMRLVVEELEKALGHQQVIELSHPKKALSGFSHDVFVGVRGGDRSAEVFASCNLKRALDDKGFRVYFGKTHPHKESVPLEAIKQSRSTVIVFSNYDDGDTWNSDVATKIIECAKERNQFVLPIFFKMEHGKKLLSKYLGKELLKYLDDGPKLCAYGTSIDKSVAEEAASRIEHQLSGKNTRYEARSMKQVRADFLGRRR